MRNRSAGGDELALDEIVRTTIDLLDESGLAAFTMRALGTRLGRSPMAAYRHVASRESLLVLAANEAASDPPGFESLPWHERLEQIIRYGWTTTWSVHPWIVELMHGGTAQMSGGRRMHVIEEVYREAGFDDADVRNLLIAHWSFVVGTLRVVLGIRAAAGDHDHSEDQIFDFNLRTYVLGVRAMSEAVAAT